MILSESNTYIEVTAGTALSTARTYQNSNFRALLTNFYSEVAPNSINLTVGGNPFSVPNGTLYRSSTTSALYVSDSINVKSSPVGGNFTRVGIGNRVENGIVALAANVSTYEIGELVATVSASGGLASNARLYLCSANTGTMSDMIDVGTMPGLSVSTDDNVIASGQSVRAIRFLATANVGIGTNSPTQALDVVGNIVASGDINSASDYRLKKDIRTIDNALSKVASMRGVYFTKDNKNSLGLVAQEVEEVLPEVVTTNEYKSVAYGNIVGVLVEAIKELQGKVEILEKINISKIN